MGKADGSSRRAGGAQGKLSSLSRARGAPVRRCAGAPRGADECGRRQVFCSGAPVSKHLQATSTLLMVKQ